MKKLIKIILIILFFIFIFTSYSSTYKNNLIRVNLIDRDYYYSFYVNFSNKEKPNSFYTMGDDS